MSGDFRRIGVVPILMLLTFCLFCGVSFAQPYLLGNDVLDDGGMKMTSSGYILRGSFGQPTIGKITSSNTIAYIGFWHPPYAPFTGVEEELVPDPVPRVYSLSQNYPNPVSLSTTIRYGLPTESLVNLRVFNILGQRVITLVNEKKKPGSYRVTWDLRGVNRENLPNGIYFYRITVGAIHELPLRSRSDVFTSTKKMVILR